MFGLLRFILAQIVVFSHVFPIYRFNVGASAVVMFFMLSGYVMTHLFDRHFAGRPSAARSFYIDRFLRIYPQYFLYLTLTLISLAFLDFSFFGFYFSGEGSLSLFLLNATIIPVNLHIFYEPLARFLLIPPAWSLGLEEQFYLLFPFVFSMKWLKRLLTPVSMCVFTVAAYEVIPGEAYSFRLLPGVFFIFIIGKSLAEYQIRKDRESLWTLVGLYVFVAVLFVIFWTGTELSNARNYETLSAILLGLPLIAGLSLLPRQRLDDHFGSASYGIFLNHVLTLAFLHQYRLFTSTPWEFATAGMILSAIFGYGSHWAVERYLDKLRYRLRKPRAPKFDSPPDTSRRLAANE